MTDQIIKRIDFLQESIEKHYEIQIKGEKELVKLSVLMEAHLKNSEEYRIMRNEKEEEINKTLKVVNNAIGTGKSFLYIGGFITTIGGAILIIKNLFFK